MIYAILAVIFIGIGMVDIAPFVDWLDDRNLPIGIKSAVMIAILGAIPALIVGITIVGDTFWGKRSR